MHVGIAAYLSCKCTAPREFADAIIDAGPQVAAERRSPALVGQRKRRQRYHEPRLTAIGQGSFPWTTASWSSDGGYWLKEPLPVAFHGDGRCRMDVCTRDGCFRSTRSSRQSSIVRVLPSRYIASGWKRGRHQLIPHYTFTLSRFPRLHTPLQIPSSLLLCKEAQPLPLMSAAYSWP